MVHAIVLMVLGIAAIAMPVWRGSRKDGRRVPILGFLALCLLWVGLVTTLAINPVAGAVLIVLGLVIIVIPGRWKHRLRSGQVRKLPPQAVDALIAMYSAALADRDAGQPLPVSAELPRALWLPDLALLQLSLLICAVRPGRRPLPEQELARFVSDARAARIMAAQLIDPAIAPRILDVANKPGSSSMRAFAAEQDYRNRLLPTVVGLTAFAYSRIPGSPDRWQDRLRNDLRRYERQIGFRFGPASQPAAEPR